MFQRKIKKEINDKMLANTPQKVKRQKNRQRKMMSKLQEIQKMQTNKILETQQVKERLKEAQLK